VIERAVTFRPTRAVTSAAMAIAAAFERLRQRLA